MNTVTSLTVCVGVGSVLGRGIEFRPDKSVVSKARIQDFGKLALEAEQIL